MRSPLVYLKGSVATLRFAIPGMVVSLLLAGLMQGP
jgi:hypothetical protein